MAKYALFLILLLNFAADSLRTAINDITSYIDVSITSGIYYISKLDK